MFTRRKKNKARFGVTDAEDTMCLTDPFAVDSSSSPLQDKAKGGGRFSRKEISGNPLNNTAASSKEITSMPAAAGIKNNTTESELYMKNNYTAYNSNRKINSNQQTFGMVGTGNTTTSPQSAAIFRSNEHHTSSATPKPSISHTTSESSASSAMGSDVYINSLENIIPTSSDNLLRSVKEFPVLNVQSDKKVKGALSREVGRSGTPATSLEQWFVRVGEPKWDEEEGRYKYKIKLTKNKQPSFDSFTSQLSFNEVTATRTLQDFVWLEKALRAEFHGALIAPLLSLTIYFATVADKSGVNPEEQPRLASPIDSQLGVSWNATIATSQSIKFLGQILDQGETVDKDILESWLSDVINGVRGSGEVTLHYDADVLQSEALETFLFRHAEALSGVSPSQMGANQHRSSSLGSPFDLFSRLGENVGDGCNNTILSLGDVIKTPLACFDNACAGFNRRDSRKNFSKSGSRKIYSSGATGISGLNYGAVLSESDFDDAWLLASTPNSVRSELLEAERDFIASSIKYSSDGISRVQTLVKNEDYVGQCWQNLATALSDLFSVEKDLETAHIGDKIKSNKKNQPFRKLRKSTVNEVLLSLAQGKIDRARPGLLLLGSMLSAYYTDLNSVVPSFKEYSDAIRQIEEFDESQSIKEREKQNTSPFDQLKSFITTAYQSNETMSRYSMDDEGTLGSLNTTQSKALQKRILSNGKMLTRSVTSLCKASSLRNARMAWWYFKTEAKQTANVHAAAVALRQALSIDADTAIAMKERRYDEDETNDDAVEIDLVKRILDLGEQNFSLSNNDSTFENSPFSESVQGVINMAIDQSGRWSSDTALTILQAAGVVDAQEKIDETSRELRHVRKYADSLRENLDRCLEAVATLAMVWDAKSDLRISKSRREFWAAMSTIFSGKVLSNDSHNARVLASAGIDTQDRGGWLGVNSDKESSLPQRRRCGEAAKLYLKKRDSQAGILISRISKLLNEYERRLEGIESFVNMHTIGIQLEKHCSVVRAKSLSAWEKRTDISTAINVATKKKIPKLVNELKMKLDGLPQVSHTTVIKAKENHLASKVLKSDLQKLANRRLGRAQDVSTERVIAIVSLWAKHEESVAMEEMKALGEAVQEVELSVQASDVDIIVDDFSLLSGKDEVPKKEPKGTPKHLMI